MTAAVENLDRRGRKRRPHRQCVAELVHRQRRGRTTWSASTATTCSTAARARRDGGRRRHRHGDLRAPRTRASRRSCHRRRSPTTARTGESDNVKTDVENLIGGSGKDSLTGSGGSERDPRWRGQRHASPAGRATTTSTARTGTTASPEGAAPTAPTISSGVRTSAASTIGDLVDYDQRATSVHVSIDDAADDGASGENDNVHVDVESARGGSRGDVLVGSSAANQLFGLGGPDSLDGGTGPDVLSGGGAVDTATYASRTAPLEVSLNGIANDGEITANELDNVLEDVENVVGGSSNDSFFGSPAAEPLHRRPRQRLLRRCHGARRLPGRRQLRHGRLLEPEHPRGGLDRRGGERRYRRGQRRNRRRGRHRPGRRRGLGRRVRQRSPRRQRRPELHRGLLGKTATTSCAASAAQTRSAAAPAPTSWRAATGNDRAFYDDHTGPVDVSLDDVANDGNSALERERQRRRATSRTSGVARETTS